ncbi:MAG: S-layer homology domain-containing protein [Clostridia bacterium]|nr:S-layer homology domain-containing protein [Clostridia bacterium]
MKKLISFVLTFAMLMTTVCTVLPVGADSADKFTDVAGDAWYRDAVNYVASNGIMGGAGSDTTFKPADLSTRSMIAVILHRLEGEPAAKKDSPFTDLKQDWYVAAVEWAYESGVVKGSSDTTFNPDGNITRQEIVTMLYRFARYKKLDTADKGKTDSFSDKADVAPWASEAVVWALGAGLLNGRNESGKVLLAPLGNTQRCEMATIFQRFCEKYELFKEDTETPTPTPDVMTLEEVLADIKSDRVKKVIIDADAGNEFDDQYAIAYALSCEKLDVVSINASQFENKALVPTREAGMMKGYDEIKEILAILGREDIPVYKGVGDTVTKPDDSGIGYPEVKPKNAEAVDNIINTVKNSNEIVYIMTTGCATNVACALAKDPSIKDNMCVVWLGANFYDSGAGEFNFGQDRTAGRYMMNSGVKLVWLPAISSDSTKGTQTLKTGRKFLEDSFPGSDPVSKCFGGELAAGHDGGFNSDPDGWWHIFWDVAAPALFDTPELCEFEIIKLWRIRGDDSWDNNTKDRPSCIILNKLTDPQKVLENMAAGINTFVK